MDAAKKQDSLDKHAEKYKTTDAAKKQDLLDKQAEKYKTMDTAKRTRFIRQTIYINGQGSKVQDQFNLFPLW